MKLYIGADHNGFHLKARLIEHLQQAGYAIEDLGDNQLVPDDDFPLFAAQVVGAMKADTDTDARGILICGSGQGMCMAANRFKGIRASLCDTPQEARVSRNDDDANILCLPARVLELGQAEEIVKVWLQTPFAAADRFKRRVAQLDQLS